MVASYCLCGQILEGSTCRWHGKPSTDKEGAFTTDASRSTIDYFGIDQQAFQRYSELISTEDLAAYSYAQQQSIVAGRLRCFRNNYRRYKNLLRLRWLNEHPDCPGVYYCPETSEIRDYGRYEHPPYYRNLPHWLWHQNPNYQRRRSFS